MNNFDFNSKPDINCGFIYKYTSPSGKSYIGQTIHSLQERAKNANGDGYKACSAFYQAIEKYGFNNFNFEILGQYSIEELDEKEKYFIQKYDTIVPKGYNILPGGSVTFVKSYPRKTKIDQYDLNGKYIKTYDSLKQAADELNTQYQSISAVLTGKRSQHNGFIYRYHGEQPPEPVKVAKVSGRTTAQYDLNGNLLAIYPSAIKAALAIGKNENAARNIRSVCYGDRKTAFGYIWKFLD